MTQLYEKSLNKLELNQVLSMLAGCAGSYDGKEVCLHLQPTSDLEEVKTLLGETSAACELAMRKGNPGFSGVCNILSSVERAVMGGSLSPKELLAVAGLLRCSRNISTFVSEDDKQTQIDYLFRGIIPLNE